MPSKLKVYFLHNIDGKRCAMIAATSKREVRTLIRLPPSEIAEALHAPDAQAMALADPGALFVAHIREYPMIWRPDPSRRRIKKH